MKENELRNQNWPKPVGWRILIDPIKAKTVTDGGILLTAESQHAEASLNYVGRVVDVGPLCYQHDKFVDGAAWCKIGDYVAYGQYAGQSITVKDQGAIEELRMLREDIAAIELEIASLKKEAQSFVGSQNTQTTVVASLAKANQELANTRQKAIEIEQAVEHKLRLLNDDEILAVIPNKDAIRIYI